MKILVLAGGLSSERDVSFATGTMVGNALREKGHQVALVDLFCGVEDPLTDLDAFFCRRRLPHRHRDYGKRTGP